MDVLEIIRQAAPALFVAASIGSFAAVVRWASRVDRSITNTMKATELLVERLNGHERLDDVRYEAMQREVDLLRANGPGGRVRQVQEG